ncbi:hypothetical protein [Sneathiella chinensis]|uniref:Uncharacterized protein n=1 Tax=Sneathiella chinensis TaxID=349750 RepID=A0ABQ5U6T8_9PROT|nr:hypothetical protein [Sneathiella chinensis]GLQ07116.1 hypothetical protein GCM10007924_23370 [Sneathiella chinensis]
MNKQAIRSRNLLAAPTRIEPAFDDAAGIHALVAKGSPYKTLSAVHRNPEMTSGGWFRNFWALGGKVVFEGAEPYFYNSRFIAAAKQSFQAEIIRPVAMMTNFNLPAPEAPAHLDLPFFRGIQNREVPSWMLAPMGYSNLFHEWAIPVASAITWFYEGEGGEFEYWPNGLDGPSLTERPPYTNRSVLADNEYMYHRVGAIGAREEQKRFEGLDYHATLNLTASNMWEVREGEQVVEQYAYGQVRLSILWKAYCFRSQQEADSYDDHSHDLTADMVVDIFCQDLTRRGIAHQAPTDLVGDKAWHEVITSTYSAPQGAAAY